MTLRDELHISKPLEPGQEILLALLLTRELATRLADERLFKPAGLTDQQFNVLRILKGGPAEGYLIREIRRRMIFRSADVPRLVDRMVRADLVVRCPDPSDRRGCLVKLTAQGEALEAQMAPGHTALCEEMGSLLEPWENKALLGLIQQLRDGLRKRLGPTD